MRLLSIALCALTATAVVAADEFKPEPGFAPLFNGKTLDGWQQKAAKKGDKPVPLEGKADAFAGRFVAKDGELVLDPKVKGDRYIETVRQFSGDFTVRFDFKPGAGCNNDVLLLGTKCDIKAGGKDAGKGVKVDEWNTFEAVVKDGTAEFRVNGEKAAAQKVKDKAGPLVLRAEFGPITIRNVRASDGGKK